MKKIILDEDTNTILLANVKNLKDGLVEVVGTEPEDITNDVLKVAFNWFLNQKTNDTESVVSFKNSKYELALREKNK